VTSPLGRHAGRPRDVKERLDAERRGLPFLMYRDGAANLRLHELSAEHERLFIGRGPACEICLDWDRAVSRVHAELRRAGDDWILGDDGLSSNGTFVDGLRVTGRRRLADGDHITVGDTVLAFRVPAASAVLTTLRRDGAEAKRRLTPAQQRVLVALCRPFRDALYATPASNQRIAEELVVGVDAVKRTLRSLYAVFGVDHMPQNEKRAALALLALQSGAVGRHEL
jgi:pSer/pThr/pTyr-binding forkhead associated (FHA) protein